MHIPEQWDRSSCIPVFAVFVGFFLVLDVIFGPVVRVWLLCIFLKPAVELQVRVLILYCGSVSVKGNEPFAVLCVSSLNSSGLFSLHFFLTSSVPPSVGHCSAHPPFSHYPPCSLCDCSTHNPTSTACCISPFPLLFPPFLLSVFVLHAMVYHSPGCSSSQNIVTISVSDGGPDYPPIHSSTCSGQCYWRG